MLKTKNWGTRPIMLVQLSGRRRVYELRPVELHLKENGAIQDKPSFLIGLEVPGNVEFYYGQVSLEMLAEGFRELGYSLTKIERP